MTTSNLEDLFYSLKNKLRKKEHFDILFVNQKPKKSTLFMYSSCIFESPRS